MRPQRPAALHERWKKGLVQYVDFNKNDWHGKFKRGDVFRSLEASICGVCGCKSNKWEMGGYPGLGPRLVCPGNRKFPELHEEMSRKRQTIDLNGHYGMTALPRAVLAELKVELEEDKKKFVRIKPDVKLEKKS